MNALQAFRSELERLFPNGGRRRYTERLKHLALSHADAVKRSGGTLQQAARELGVDSNSVRKWRDELELAEARGASPMQPVTVIADDSYVVLGPGGLRVECRSAEAVARLFAAFA